MRYWLQAFRPKTLSAAIVPVCVGVALTFAEGHSIFWGIGALTLLGALFIQLGTNLVNDAIDFKKGADTEERIGPQRVTQSGLIKPKTVMMGGFVCFFLAFLCGVPLVLTGGWPIVLIGLLSLFFGYAYTGGPYPLAYKGLGDLFVILFFGLVAVGGTFYLQTGLWSLGAFVAGLQVGLLATVLIAINNLRDVSQDEKANKKTLAVRFGVSFARHEIQSLVVLSFLLNLYWVKEGYLWAAILPLLALPLSIKLVQSIWQNSPGTIYNQYLARAGALHLFFGLSLALGLVLV